MTTTIGSSVQGERAAFALLTGISAVGIDWWLIWLNRFPESNDGRWALALVGCTVQLCLAHGDLAAIGLTAPIGGWRRWIRIGGCLLVMVLVVAAIAFGAWTLRGEPLPKHLISQQHLSSALILMCVFAPLLEESIYRVILCMGVAAAFGGSWSIVSSGIAFAALHFVYGNPSPENLLGGFILSWAYVRSGSLYVPLLLHSGGNALVWLAHLGVNLLLAKQV